MNKEQIESLIEYWQERLKLQHWTIRVNWDVYPNCEDAMAQVMIIEGRYYAGIIFHKDIFEEEVENISLYVCHELMHLHLNQIWNTQELMLQNKAGCVISKDFIEDMQELFHRDIEHATDAISTAFAEAFLYEIEETCQEEIVDGEKEN